jgi:hypothetical protein
MGRAPSVMGGHSSPPVVPGSRCSDTVEQTLSVGSAKFSPKREGHPPRLLGSKERPMSIVVPFLILTLVGRAQELIPFLAYMKPVAVAMLVSAVTLVVSFPYHTMGQRWSRPTLFWFLTTLGFLISLPTSIYPGRSAEFLFMTYSCTCFLFLLVSQCIRKQQTMEQIALTLMVMTLLLGIGIIVNPRRLITDHGFRYSVSESYDSNDLAVVFAMSIPFVFFWFWRGGPLVKLLAIGTSLLAVLGIHLTGSRGGLLALATVIMYMVLRVKELGPVLRVLLVVGMLLGGALATQTETFNQLILAAKGQDYNTQAEDGRIEVWKRGLGYALTHPVNGVGVFCFEIAEGKLSGRSTTSRGIRWTSAHNSYVQVLAENGFPGFLFWCAMIYSSIRELRRQRDMLLPYNDDPQVERFLVLRGMIQTSLLAYVVGAFFLSLGYLCYLYLVVGMTIAMGQIADQLKGSFDDLESYDEVESEGQAEPSKSGRPDRELLAGRSLGQ